MASRLSQRPERHHSYWWLLIVIVVIALPVAGYFIFYQPEPQSQPATVASGESHQVPSTQSAVTASDLIGKGFSLSPIRYNGEPVDQAMDAGRAPQGTVHDNARLGFFKSKTIAVMGGVSAIFFKGDVGYTINDGHLILDGKSFKLQIRDGKIVPSRL